MRMLATIAALFVAALTPLSAMAQGALSNQGFGYPLGQLSGAARGTAGATSESDPNSPINPAAITQPNRFSVMVQFEPEFRRTSVPGAAGATAAIVRFPGFAATTAFRKFVFSASVSTFLDRTWENEYADSVLVGGSWVPSATRTSSNGAIGDARVAVGYIANRRLQVGLGLHSFSGENRIAFTRVFPDSTGVSSVIQATTIGYAGRALSAGVVTNPIDGFVIAASARFGGVLSADQAGEKIGTAEVPSRFGVGASWLAVPGVSVNARFDRTLWSEMDGLGSAAVTTFDADEIGLGVELLGPRVGGANSLVRLGVRDRTLPFGVNGQQVSERAFSGGVGMPFARGRAQLDLAVERAMREGAGATERGWFVSFGIGFRP